MTTELLTHEPADLIPPGQTLVDWLKRTGMTQADFARAEPDSHRSTSTR